MIRDTTTLKSFFETGDKPSQSQFDDVVDTLENALSRIDDITVSVGDVAAIFEFVQESDATLWTVNHNLGIYPIVEITDLDRHNVETDYYHLDTDTVIVSNLYGCTGYVRCHH